MNIEKINLRSLQPKREKNKMINPKKEDIGKIVYYKQGTQEYEFGIITSFNDSYIFVMYDGDIHSKATRREDLEWDLK